MPDDAASQPTAAVPKAATAILQVNLQRITQTVDPLSAQGTQITNLTTFRTNAVTHIYLGLTQLNVGLQKIIALLGQPTIPTPLTGVLLQPDGTTKAASVQIQFSPQSVGGKGSPVTAISAADGSFALSIPSGLAMPQGTQGSAESPGVLAFLVHGANGYSPVSVPTAQIASNGFLGAITLPQNLSPVPVSILQALQNITAGTSAPTAPAQSTSPAQIPAVKLGENGPCQINYGGNQSVDKFPFGMFFRLVAPQLSIYQQITTVPVSEGNLSSFYPLPVYDTPNSNPTGTVSYSDRVPVEQPLSVDGFREQIMGLDPSSGTFVAEETIPMAATLGLGYVLSMSQQWTYQGVALGNLVYSLPLAPGEQQQVAVFERVDTTAVSESETLSEQQQQQQSALADTSTLAVFQSAFNEVASGSSAFTDNSKTNASSPGLWGMIFGSNGSGGTNSSGTSSESLQGQLDSAQQAAEFTHSSTENQASARRTAARTGMRLATASEDESVTTKTITNHNHAHALTMQYWEVQRLYDVTTAIDGVRLACLVPMQIVRFMPPGQSLTITSPSMTRADVLARYSVIIKHLDVLQGALPRAYQSGLTLLRQFVSDPLADVESAGGTAEDVIQFTLIGTFVPCEDITITAVTNRKTRVGPASLTPKNNVTIPQDKFVSQDDLLAYLGGLRLAPVPLTGALALPPSLNRSDVIGFEITRTFRKVDYTLASLELTQLQQLQNLFGGSGSTWIPQAIEAVEAGETSSNSTTIHLAPSDLETALGGPTLTYFSAFIEELDGGTSSPTTPPPAAKGETYAADALNGIVLPLQPYPIPALQVAPVLRYNELLTIEAMVQHVVRNTTRYSKAVWSSMTNEERAILLDQYTIGVPPGGVPDASQMVPLLDCVQNTVLGYSGNCMIMPFLIPDAVTGVDPAQIQESLLAYLQANFVPPQSVITLPTQGVLGEAVLGCCPSAEKIDLTRFWNWQDSPADSAPTISPVTVPTTSPSIAAGLTAPNSLGQLPNLINNVVTAPTPATSLAQALGQDAASQQALSPSLTGAAQLASVITNAQTTANSARSDALKATSNFWSQAMATVGNIAGGEVNNPTAGSSAASAVYGTTPPAAAAKPAATTPATKTTPTTPTQTNPGGANAGTTSPATPTTPTTPTTPDAGF